MLKNELYFNDDVIIRVLEVREDRVLVIDCVRRTMPQWKEVAFLAGWEKCSEEKLYEIAEKVGYSDPKYFSRVFKETTGMLPAEYRKVH